MTNFISALGIAGCVGFSHVADFESPLRKLLQGIPKSPLFQTQVFLQIKIYMTRFAFVLGTTGMLLKFPCA